MNILYSVRQGIVLMECAVLVLAIPRIVTLVRRATIWATADINADISNVTRITGKPVPWESFIVSLIYLSLQQNMHY